ncbi:hypothetical protein [Methylomonas methanica]|uniref:Uncharacterized protein n=1 Tax=Methylomonas methanica (strain DSM 25384 / MC09) TaxID=857087 RepID=G0A4U4_METMM|nr:hypothetical protein [Methylomonas methanica]AEG02835.1 hypothetical protein Metme_4495 [Methylomonas methanica MC09]
MFHSVNNKLLELFNVAEKTVKAHGYGWEIEWQREREFANFLESEFLREVAWVILCSGFKESIVTKKFDYISLCFCDWESAIDIINNRDVCLLTARSIFKNEKKLNAIVRAAEIVHENGFYNFKSKVHENPIQVLQELPYIGQVTSWHLAKNLGLKVAKNDRHLARIAQNWGYSDAHSLCGDISMLTSVPASVVDIILWRYAVIHGQKDIFNS